MWSSNYSLNRLGREQLPPLHRLVILKRYMVVSTRRQLLAMVLVLTVLLGPAALVAHVHAPGHEGPDCIVCVLLAAFAATLPTLVFISLGLNRRQHFAFQPVAYAPVPVASAISPRAPPA